MRYFRLDRVELYKGSTGGLQLRISNYQKSVLFAITAVSAFSAGCARAVIGSDIKADGTWTRTVEFHAPGGDGAANPAAGMLKSAKMEDSFVVPKAPYIITRYKEGEENIIKATRKVALNEVITHDITVLSKDDKKGTTTPVLVNETSVKETAPGVFTYTERLHWVGPMPKNLLDVDSKKMLLKFLPADLATEENAKRCSVALEKELLMVFMGPPDPLFGQLMSIIANPDLAKFKLSARLRAPIEKVLADQFGQKLSAPDRNKITTRIVNETFDSSQAKYNPAGDPTALGNKSDTTGSGTALTFSINYPGKLVSSNGDTDPGAHRVFWGMYPEAAVLGDITLTAVVTANDQQTAKR